jgi:hypothetical protein
MDVAEIPEGRVYFGAVTIGSAESESAEDEDLFDSLVAKAARERM